MLNPREIVQPKPSPTLPSPNPKLGARVCTNMQVLSLSRLSLPLSLPTQVSHLLRDPYISANSTRIFMKL